MTEFNNLDIEMENINTGEESEISSPESVLQENLNSAEEVNNNLNAEEAAKEPPTNSFLNKIFDIDLFVEKNKIKTDATTIGASFLVMYFVISALNLMVSIVGVILGMSKAYDAIEILNSPAFIQVLQIIFSIISFTFPFVFIFKCSSIRISDLVSFSPPKRKHIIPFFLFGISFCAFANIISAIMSSIFEKTNIDYEVTNLENPKGFFGFMLVFISTVIVPALVEEFICRGLVLGLLRKYGDGFAIIASSLLFGVMHGNFEQIPFAFLVGLVLGFITVKSGTILIAVAVHAFNNFIPVSFDYFFAGLPQIYQNVMYIIFFVTSLLLGVFAIFLASGVDEDIYTLTPAKMKATESKKAVWFFTSVPVVIYLVLCLVDSFEFFVF